MIFAQNLKLIRLLNIFLRLNNDIILMSFKRNEIQLRQ